MNPKRIYPGDEDIVAEFFNSNDVIIYNTATDVWVNGHHLSPTEYDAVVKHKYDTYAAGSKLFLDSLRASIT